jgi:FkbM family methyltransferase
MSLSSPKTSEALLSSPAATYPKTPHSSIARQARELVRGAALFVRDSALLSRSQLSLSGRLRIWKDFLKVSLLSSEASGQADLAGFHVSYFDQATLLYLFREIFVRQTYWFTTEVRRPVILDCGANLGMATFFFKSMFPDAHIHCFEPDPLTFGLLQHNVEANQLSQATLHNVALWNEDTEVPFFFDAQAPGSLLMSTNANRANGDRILVPARRLSSYIEGDIDLLKLDVEGAELRVMEELAASGKILSIKQMIVEYHHKIPGEPSNLSHLLQIFENQGFEYQVAASGFPLAQPERFQDVLIYAYQS